MTRCQLHGGPGDGAFYHIDDRLDYIQYADTSQLPVPVDHISTIPADHTYTVHGYRRRDTHNFDWIEQ